MKNEIYLFRSKDPGGTWTFSKLYGFPTFKYAEDFLFRHGWNRLEMPNDFVYINDNPGKIPGHMVRITRLSYEEDPDTGKTVYEEKEFLTKEEILCYIQQPNLVRSADVPPRLPL